MLVTMGKVTYSHDLSLAALQSSTVSNKVVFEPGSIQILSPMLNSTGFLSSTLDLRHQGFIRFGPRAKHFGLALTGSMLPVVRRDNLQYFPNRLDPIGLVALINKDLSGLESAIELRLGKKSTRQLEDFVGLAQFFDFTH